jgi:hypothetical protein
MRSKAEGWTWTTARLGSHSENNMAAGLYDQEVGWSLLWRILNLVTLTRIPQDSLEMGKVQ